MNDLISVIIPVYNVEPYLCKCLDSVLASTYSNLEILLIDDGSIDNSGTICDEYAVKDKRITVIHQKNKGLSEARNTGLALATGNFIGFVDSDDMISPVLYEALHRAITSTDSDIAACEYTRDEALLDRELIFSPHLLRVVNGRDNCVGVSFGLPSTRKVTWTGAMVWDKLYRKEIISSSFSKQHEPAEDLHFNLEYARNCSRMVIVPMRLYYWYINPQSITQTFTVEIIAHRAYAMMDIAQKIPNAGIPLQNHLHFLAASSAHFAIWKIYGNKNEAQYFEFIAKAREIISCYYRELISHEDTVFNLKIFYVLCIGISILHGNWLQDFTDIERRSIKNDPKNYSLLLVWRKSKARDH